MLVGFHVEGLDHLILRAYLAKIKEKFYGKPEPTRVDVENVALPLIRALGIEQLEGLKERSKSFEQFAQQVNRWREKIMGDRDCW